jgi:hypothetical protein
MGSPAFASAKERLQSHPDQKFTELFRRTNGWVAGDGGFSIPLPVGASLWLFGDSHINDFDPATGTVPCLFQARNAGFLVPAGDYTAVKSFYGTGRGFRSWFRDPVNDQNWFWPICGYHYNGQIFIYLSGLERSGHAGMWDFQGTHHDFWARIGYPEMGAPLYLPLPDFAGISFGNGFVIEGGFVYAFGERSRDKQTEVFAARFKPVNPDKLWAFWDGSVWGPDPRQSHPIARAKSSSVHVCKVKGKFLLTSSAFSIACDQGRDIFVGTSASPTGPFSAMKSVYRIMDKFRGHYPFFYLPVAHPEYLDAGDELLITYSINGYEPCVKLCEEGRMQPDHYRPRAIRVPLKLIDSAF